MFEVFHGKVLTVALAAAVLSVGCGENAQSPQSTIGPDNTTRVDAGARDDSATGITTASCVGLGPLAGAVYDVSKSRFAFGSTPAREDSAGMTRFVGDHGVVAIFTCGAATGLMNADAPELARPDWSTDTNLLIIHTLDYFAALGVEGCQVARTDVHPEVATGQATQVSIALSRAVDGIPVAESSAYARFDVDDQTTSEGLYWPAIPAETVAAAKALRDQLADPGALAAYRAKLPAVAQGAGVVTIHHTSGSFGCDAPITAMATYDVGYGNADGGGGGTLSFDASGVSVATSQSVAYAPADSACLGPSLSEGEARGLCRWGAAVLGPAGTVFKAACLDIVVDAGASAPDRSAAMVDMIVVSEDACVSRMRTDGFGCSYTVGQLKSGINAFHDGNCGAGAGLSLVDYLQGYHADAGL